MRRAQREREREIVGNNNSECRTHRVLRGRWQHRAVKCLVGVARHRDVDHERCLILNVSSLCVLVRARSHHDLVLRLDAERTLCKHDALAVLGANAERKGRVVHDDDESCFSQVVVVLVVRSETYEVLVGRDAARKRH